MFLIVFLADLHVQLDQKGLTSGFLQLSSKYVVVLQVSANHNLIIPRLSSVFFYQLKLKDLFTKVQILLSSSSVMKPSTKLSARTISLQSEQQMSQSFQAH